HSVHFGSIPQLSSRIDKSPTVASLLCPPRAVGIEIFQRKSDVIHQFVTTGARLVFSVKRHLLAKREDLGRSGCRVFEWRAVRRGVGGGCAQNVFKDPDTPL